MQNCKEHFVQDVCGQITFLSVFFFFLTAEEGGGIFNKIWQELQEITMTYVKFKILFCQFLNNFHHFL